MPVHWVTPRYAFLLPKLTGFGFPVSMNLQELAEFQVQFKARVSLNILTLTLFFLEQEHKQAV